MQSTPFRTRFPVLCRVRRYARLAATGLVTLLAATAAVAAPPPAGAVIGNQAAASYIDASNVQQTATSNLVQTVVQQVGVFTLTANNTKSAAPGGTAYMPHTLTNTGNGPDTFKLQLADVAGGFNFSAQAIYLDADGNGLPDGTTPLVSGTTEFTTPSVPSGGSYRFVVALTVPTSPAPTGADSVTLTATASSASLYGTSSITNTDTVNVSFGAVFSVSKTVNQSLGASSTSACTGAPYTATGCVKLTYTLTYANNGASTGHLYLSDVIGSGSTTGFEYVAGSARWNGSGVLTDAVADGGEPSGIAFQAVTATGVTTLQAVVADVAPGASGVITFEVGVKSSATVGTSSTSNSATFGVAVNTTVAGGATGGTTQPSNASAYTVTPRHQFVANNGTHVAGVPTDGDNVSAAGPDVVLLATAVAGSTQSFNNTLWNTGNTTDTYNVTLSEQASFGFPAGTSFALYRADGTTPLTDSNGDGVVDTGPIAAGQNLVFVVKATIPGNACTPLCPTQPAYTVHVTATSVGNPGLTNKAFNRVGSITAPSVTLAWVTTPAVNGLWGGGANPAVTTNTVAAGASTSFDLRITNTAATGSPADIYELQSSATNFVAGTVPVVGWTVSFRNGACAANGTVITSTTPVAAGGTFSACAVVTTTSISPAATSDLYFKAVSGNTGVSATLRVAAAVTATVNLSLSPSNSGQAGVGGSVIYPHTLTNNGNQTCTGVAGSVSQTLASQGWTAAAYHDVNGNGLLDSGDPLVGSLADLAPGATVRLLLRVFVPGGAAIGANDVATITITATCGSSAVTATATDRTTVVSGQLRLVKRQVLDGACASPASPTYSDAQLSARAGQCILYEVVATNLGSVPVTAVSVTDITPPNTTLSKVATCTPGTVTTPALNGTGSVGCSVASLAPSAQIVLTFGVRIDGP